MKLRFCCRRKEIWNLFVPMFFFSFHVGLSQMSSSEMLPQSTDTEIYTLWCIKFYQTWSCWLYMSSHRPYLPNCRTNFKLKSFMAPAVNLTEMNMYCVYNKLQLLVKFYIYCLFFTGICVTNRLSQEVFIYLVHIWV